MYSDRKIQRTGLVCIVFLGLAVLSCSTPRKYAGTRERPSLSLPDDRQDDADDAESHLPVAVDSSDTGDGPVIMNAIRDDETGEMTATDVIAASKVVARFRNIAERFGKISITFDVTVPEGLISSEYQLQLSPIIEKADGNSVLEPVLITGNRYRKRQLRGYERYRAFMESIITDSTAFIRMELLETFLERYFPETSAMKNDSSAVPEPLAENLFGVSQKAALEHYTKQMMKKRNAMKIQNRDVMFKKYVRAPFAGNVRLDTVMKSGEGSLVYRYSHSMEPSPGLRKLTVSLNSCVFKEGEQVASLPEPEKLTFYISSLSTLADDTPRYIFKIVERIVTDRTAAILDFRKGSRELDTLSENNSAELKRIRKCFDDVFSRQHLILDSVIVTASCSPEGLWSYNRRLAYGRSETVKSYILHCFPEDWDRSLIRTESIPENWDYLSRLVKNDTVLSEPARNLILSAAAREDKDAAERELSYLPEYRYLREKIYPRLRTVNFSFHLHRPDMQKDTIHTTVLDTVYMNGLAALKNLEYRKAVALLGPYRDYNAALAMASSGYDGQALSILSGLDTENARTDYLKALLLSRAGDMESAYDCYSRCIGKDPSMKHRANLDPEMSRFTDKLF